MITTAEAPPDPFCDCGYRKSVHDAGELPKGSGCRRFYESAMFNDRFDDPRLMKYLSSKPLSDKPARRR